MNTHNLHEFIKRYEENINLIYGDVHDELFKWQAMKVWRDEWFKPDTAFASFADRFNAARKEFSLFIDNSRMHPSTGVIKLWEKEPFTRFFLPMRTVMFPECRTTWISSLRNMRTCAASISRATGHLSRIGTPLLSFLP